MLNKKILIADEDEDIVSKLKDCLTLRHYEVFIAKNGKEAFTLATKEPIDLIILEVSLSELDGFSVCRLLRTEGVKTPIIFLTNKTSEISAVIGLELGAQDYIRKPVQIRELLTRIDIQLMKNKVDIQRKIAVNDLEIDIDMRQVKRKGQVKELTNKEFQLLHALAKCPNKVFERNELLNQIWGYSRGTKTRTLDLHMGYLRRKLEENPRRPNLLKTIRGVGYYLSCELN